MQQERLRALGQMASGIAHDINNAISPVALYTESLLETEPDLSVAGARLPGDDPARHRGRGADGGAHARVLPAARSGAGAEPGQPERRGAGRDRAHARPLERHAAAARRRDRARHVAGAQRPGDPGRRERAARGAHQPRLQRRGRDARRRHADPAHAPHVGRVTRPRRRTASTSRCPTPASAWTPRRSAAASSRSSRPRASAAPGLGLAMVYGIGAAPRRRDLHPERAGPRHHRAARVRGGARGRGADRRRR